MVSRSSDEATTTPTSDSFSVISACSRACCRSRTCSVMSRAIFEAPTISPASPRIGETVSEIDSRLPSLRCRIVS